MAINIIGSRIHTGSYSDAVMKISTWAKNADSRSVYAANVHMLMEAYDRKVIKSIINQADLVTPDGVPLVWILRMKGVKVQSRVYGPTLMLKVLEQAALDHIPVGFYGSEPETLELLKAKLAQRFPELETVYSYSPPFRALNEREMMSITEDIVLSKARILFVALGCPKQEIWISQHVRHIPAVMLGVGAAFGFHAGVVRQSPVWLQKIGLEWLFRMTQEPGRLWRRYLYNNPRFIILAIFDLVHYYLFKNSST